MSKSSRIYLDYNASAPLLECAHKAFVSALSGPGNASSVHGEGRDKRRIIEAARAQVANLIEVAPANVIFTSGATEAANYALTPELRVLGQDINVSKLLVSAVEHPCVLGGGRFGNEQITTVGVSPNGTLDLAELESTLQSESASAGRAMVAIQYANNETGVIQPIEEISDLVHQYEGIMVVDAVQTLGKVPFTMAKSGADFLILSSHKIGGPQGAGALVLADGNTFPKPLLNGGGQENHHRGGTENVAAIAGFGAACEWHAENLTKKVNKNALRDSIEAGISTISLEAGNDVAQPVFFGQGNERLDNTSCFSVPGVKAETALVALDLDGVAVSSGSACSSGKVKQSHVLEAMGATPEEMAGALRISLGWESTENDADRFLSAWKTIIGRMAA